MEIGGKVYKQYRGMGSLSAMKAEAPPAMAGRATTAKDHAEGIEALKRSAGRRRSADNLIGGVQSGMGYLGARTLASFAPRAIHPVSPAGQREAPPRRRRGLDTRELSPCDTENPS